MVRRPTSSTTRPLSGPRSLPAPLPPADGWRDTTPVPPRGRGPIDFRCPPSAPIASSPYAPGHVSPAALRSISSLESRPLPRPAPHHGRCRLLPGHPCPGEGAVSLPGPHRRGLLPLTTDLLSLPPNGAASPSQLPGLMPRGKPIGPLQLWGTLFTDGPASADTNGHAPSQSLLSLARGTPTTSKASRNYRTAAKVAECAEGRSRVAIHSLPQRPPWMAQRCLPGSRQPRLVTLRQAPAPFGALWGSIP